MGCEFCIHGLLRVRGGFAVLGCMGIQDVFRGEVVALLGESWDCALIQDALVAGGFAFHCRSSP